MTRAPSPSPRRVLYAINDLAIGGAQHALMSQALALDRARFEPCVASLELVPRGALIEACQSRGLTVHALRSGGEPRARAAARLRALIRRLRPDIVHTHLAAAGVAGRVAARLAGVPAIVSTAHNLSDWEERRRHPLRMLERGTLTAADRIVAVSDAVRDAVVRRVPRLATRVVTVRNGIDLAAYEGTAAGRAEARAELGIPGGAFVVGTIARLDPQKAIETLILALPRLSADAVLLVVGDGKERGRLTALAGQGGIAARARFTGTRADVARMLSAMDVFAVPSRTEGLGIAAMEALAAGLPVLASGVGGLVEVVDDGVTGRLLAPGEPDAWARALNALREDESTRLAMGRAAARAAVRFSIARTAAALQTVYDDALARRAMAVAA